MARHLRIFGVVQGVGYRASFEAQARALRLCGWVRNRRDGSVEAMIDGEAQAIEKIINWSRRGPSSARVSEVAVTETDEASIGDVFEVRPTQ